jgi:hypothetical protein
MKFKVQHCEDGKWLNATTLVDGRKKLVAEFGTRGKARRFIIGRYGHTEQENWRIVHPDGTKEPFTYSGVGPPRRGIK